MNQLYPEYFTVFNWHWKKLNQLEMLSTTWKHMFACRLSYRFPKPLRRVSNTKLCWISKC